MSVAGAVLLAAVLTIAGGLVLYALVRGERERGTVTDRETGERLARRDTGEPPEEDC
ncbi:hypothetical protein [Halapricum hydrolyticum]|uniref:Uncharacterized protein n=1 Tax=Halapricum hydrolyticum TaxID=2979991 RepID=A0AAE3ICQ0_9EURY|nr:hypothetical protein [Halapricum hydrolyticum]MCU4719528.1 hypothetical protein [Halapricum hydrolyticum]MCU4728188.1 hypothetical protein [Halapricum hydrolyticum]